jgi:hypothetical protein
MVESMAPQYRPVLLNVLDYNLDDGYFLWNSVVNAGKEGTPSLVLTDYLSYDAKYFRPHVHFDHWMRLYELIPISSMVKCRDIFAGAHPYGLSGTNQSLLLYSSLTNDTDFSCGMEDTIWFSPACRKNTSECIPLIILYYFDYAMQRATLLNIPLAIVLVNTGATYESDYYKNAVEGARILFHAFLPNDELFDNNGMLPMRLSLPRMNRQQQAQGVYTSGLDGLKPRNYGWRHLRASDQYVHFLASAFYLAETDMADLMAESRALKDAGLDTDAAARTAACGWVRANSDRWQLWIPAVCPPGQMSDITLTMCLACPRGSTCAGGTAQPLPCPPSFYCPANASAALSCPAGRTTVGGGATSPEDCNACLPGSVAVSVGAGCLSLSSLIVAIVLSVVTFVVMLAAVYRYCATDGDEDVVRRGVERLRTRLGLRRRDGYVLSSERLPLWRRRESLVFVHRAHIEAAARLELLRCAISPFLPSRPHSFCSACSFATQRPMPAATFNTHD